MVVCRRCEGWGGDSGAPAWDAVRVPISNIINLEINIMDLFILYVKVFFNKRELSVLGFNHNLCELSE